MSLRKTRKYISLILRHKPETIGITLDEHGWANVDELIKGVSMTIRLVWSSWKKSSVQTKSKGILLTRTGLLFVLTRDTPFW